MRQDDDQQQTATDDLFPVLGNLESAFVERSKLSSLKTMPRKSTPASVEITEPWPPLSKVPPSTTAAIAVNSQPTAKFGDPV